MKAHFAGYLACSLLLAISSCTPEPTQNPAKSTTANPPKPAPDPPKIVGRVASIPADKRFVLIQSYGKWNIGTGTILTTRGEDERSANLLVTGEALGEFAAADVQSGSVEVGDAVYSRHVPKPVTAPSDADSTPPPPAEQPASSEEATEILLKNN
jgi:hypothetical protein